MAADLATPKQFSAFVRKLFRQDWVVYAKPAFGGPEAVLRYLGRYTHRVAISNHRLLSFDGERVTFRWKDYAHGNKQRVMTLHATALCSAHPAPRLRTNPPVRLSCKWMPDRPPYSQP